MDKIWIRDLAVTTIVGTRPAERTAWRTVYLTLALGLDLHPAGANDDLMKSVNYQAVAEALLEFGRKAHFLLIEAFAEAAAAMIFRDFPLVRTIHMTLDKPGALGCARSVAVEIERVRQE